MTGIFDPAYYWLPLGILAFAFAAANLIRTLCGRRKGWQTLLFLSLSCGVFVLLAEYQMIHKWVLRSDWSALEDVVPSFSVFLTRSAFAGVILNGIVLLLNVARKKPEGQGMDEQTKAV